MNDNPVLTQVTRGGWVESEHRGAWVLVDTDGTVVDSAGDPDQAVFGRSSTKSFQALPGLETGAADAAGMDDAAVAMTLASHSGEAQHVACCLATLRHLELTEDDLGCGPATPFFSLLETQRRAQHCCSGKHAGFLALARHLGQAPSTYLDPEREVQQLIRAAVVETTGARPGDVEIAIDGCSAPTFRLPLRAAATGIARVANPGSLTPDRASACRRLTAAASAHPEMVGGSIRRLDTEVLRSTGGRVFPKMGAEGFWLAGFAESGLGLALAIDDGAYRGFHALAFQIMRRHGLMTDSEIAQLDMWSSTTVRNADGIATGTIVFP